MVKFCPNVSPLDPKEVGRISSVKREVNLLLKEYDGEKTIIKKKMWTLKRRMFVSVYCGRICVGVVMMHNLKKKGCWNIANAVIDKRARRKGLGKFLAKAAMRIAFTTNCKKMYLGAELLEYDDPVTGEEKIQRPKESGACRFWKSLGYRQVTMKEYEKVLKEKDLYGMVPMRMCSTSRHAKSLPHLEDTIKGLFPKLHEISMDIDGSEREPMLRICTQETGDVKLKENSESRSKYDTIFH